MAVVDPAAGEWVADYDAAEAKEKAKKDRAAGIAAKSAATRKANGDPRPEPPSRAKHPDLPSEDAVAKDFIERYQDFIFVAQWGKWLMWDGKRWCEDATGTLQERVRLLVRSYVEGDKAERSTANSRFIAGVARIMSTDPRVARMPDALDSDPWSLNTQSGIVDLRTGDIREHDPAKLHTKITTAGVEPWQGKELWYDFLSDISQGNNDLCLYLQRVAGYFATGDISEDVLVYLFGIGGNGKGSFAEAVAHVLGDYAKAFAPEVLMETFGAPAHPTEIAQFRGTRFALSSEPASNSSWNDSRVKQLTGDTVINARVMRGDPFTFPRTHKTMVLGNHMPRLNEVTNAIRRRVQMVPFRAVFTPEPGAKIRDRLKAECGGAILTWIIVGAKTWLKHGTRPPQAVRDLTNDYLNDQDLIGQWLDECCVRDPTQMWRANELHKSYVKWCDEQGHKPKTQTRLNEHLTGLGLRKHDSSIGKVFHGVKLK